MSARLASTLLGSALLSAVALAGCAEPAPGLPEPALPGFADTSPAQLERVFSAAAGFDLDASVLLAYLFLNRNAPTACPAVVTSGLDTTVTGGCTNDDGTRIEGTIAIHNLASGSTSPMKDPSQPSSIEIDFAVTPPASERTAFEGRVEISAPWDVRSDLTIDVDGVASMSRLALSCNPRYSCTVLAGSEIEIPELGIASVEGSWQLLGPPKGLVTVRSTDELVLHIASRNPNNCVPYTIGDKTGTVCPRKLLQTLGPL